MDFRRSPTGVLLSELTNQFAEVIRDFRSAGAAARFPPQYRRKPARCHAMTVSGLTMRSASLQPDQNRWSAIQNSRSKEFNGGRGRFRLRTATCCRSAMTSTAVAVRAKEDADDGDERNEESSNYPCNTS